MSDEISRSYDGPSDETSAPPRWAVPDMSDKEYAELKKAGLGNLATDEEYEHELETIKAFGPVLSRAYGQQFRELKRGAGDR